jgi:ATP-dependent DNA helicase RecG
MPIDTLTTPVTELTGVTKSLATKLRKLGIETISDLIFYYPFRYDDFGALLPINKLQPGMSVTVKGKIELIGSRRSSRQRKLLTEAVLTDETGSIQLIWFNQPWLSKQWRVGDVLYVSGKVGGDLFATSIVSPVCERASESTPRTMMPVYSLTAGLTQKKLQALIVETLDMVSLSENIPPSIIKKYQLLGRDETMRQLHLPSGRQELAQARTRAGFEELFLIQLWAQMARRKLHQQLACPLHFFQTEIKAFVESLGFELTADQKKAAWEILQDTFKSQPMNRLLEGDVGSGKTLVAIMAMYNVALNGAQAALMAPTEILAKQHFDTIRRLLEPHTIRVGLFTRTQQYIGDEKYSKKNFLSALQNGEVDCIVGTHALIQKNIDFKKLALVVIDEQHRFGVRQRQLLRDQGQMTPHLLSLTATPIPRSLALTLYGDLDLSIIKQMPQGRKPIETRVVSGAQRFESYRFIGEQITAGRQVFVICPLIDPSDTLGVRSVTEEFKRLNEDIFPHTAVGLLHGRLSAIEKEAVLADFVSQKTKILVATSIIEVGIDIANATVMMIEGAERFGLAQLHQFRGRVGRGAHQSYCFLLSDQLDVTASERLMVMETCHDGFVLAQRDLEIRGSGKIFGVEQSGFSDLKIARLDDLELIKKTRQAARDFIETESISDFPELLTQVQGMKLSAHLE